MIYIYDKEVKSISEFNLLHEINNPPERAKNINSHYSTILHGCINIRKDKSKFKYFRILFNSGCSSAIVIRRLNEKLFPEKYYVMQWHTQAGNITTNIKVNMHFTLPALSATNAMRWNFHVDDSAKGRYYIILGIYP